MPAMLTAAGSRRSHPTLLRSAFLFLAAVYALISARVDAAAVVYGTSISGGSLAGGSKLLVFGAGFSGTSSTGETTPQV